MPQNSTHFRVTKLTFESTHFPNRFPIKPSILPYFTSNPFLLLSISKIVNCLNSLALLRPAIMTMTTTTSMSMSITTIIIIIIMTITHCDEETKLSRPQKGLIGFAKAINWTDLANFLRSTCNCATVPLRFF